MDGSIIALVSSKAPWFDWVKARAECNVETLFDQLRQVVRDDVESARKHVPSACVDIKEGPARTAFTVIRSAPNSDVVLDAVTFSLRGSDIVVDNRESRPLTRARPALVGVDECMLEVDNCEQPMRLWQFSRSVLENLIFSGA